MDALALLCNLHADGPDTLQRLKDAGCDRLELLEAFDLPELARTLEAREEAALHFLKEARELAQRLTGRALEEGEPDREDQEAERVSRNQPASPQVPSREPPSPTPMVSRDAAYELEEAFDDAASETELDFHTCAAPGGGADDPLADVVLQAWRELDAEGPPDRDAPALDRDLIVPQPPPDGSAEGGREAGVQEPSSLVTIELEGWTTDVKRAFSDAGFVTLDDVVAADPLSLTQRSGLGFTRVVRLRFLAERALAEGVRAAGSASHAAPQSGRLPAREPESAAGPFASPAL